MSDPIRSRRLSADDDLPAVPELWTDGSVSVLGDLVVVAVWAGVVFGAAVLLVGVVL